MTDDGKNDVVERMRQRALELHEGGLDLSVSWSRADLERRLEQWPEAWGDDLMILIAGDFQPPAEDLRFESVGITVHHERKKNTVIKSALCVLQASVTIRERTIAGLHDAARRIGLLLGTWTLVGWGNGAIRWWSHITHGSMAVVGGSFDSEVDMKRAIDAIVGLPETVQTRVMAALYWVREPKSLLQESHRRDVLRVFSAYWNAFECLVEAVCILRPQQKTSTAEKRRLITDYVTDQGGSLTPGDIDTLYREVVNPGFVAKASHAIDVCLGSDADSFVQHCFTMEPKGQRLYQVRNAIAHGEIDAENIEELIRIEGRLRELWLVVWRMFGRLIPFPAPVGTPRS